MRTRTGNFRIGFRAGWTDWQKDYAGMGQWATGAGFELIDLGAVSKTDVQAVKEAGIDVISVDLHKWSSLCTSDTTKRKEALDLNKAHMTEMAGEGIKVFFAVIIPDDPEKKGKENFDLAVKGFGELATHAESLGATIVLEGWPGAPPFPNLCCNPETYRAMLKEVPSKGLSINYDPSHLIRMGIDHARFIDEFADRVGHVHGKDTEIIHENLYEVGHDQASIFKEPIFAGEYTWRYTIPGHGVTRWSYCFDVLKQAGFDGGVCIELEDATYNGTDDGEKAGLQAGLAYLATV